MYRITYALELFDGRDLEQSHAALNIMLRNLAELDALWLRRHPEAPWLYQSGVHYKEEPPGQEDWQDIPTCIRMGIADCEDLACWRAAELNVRMGVRAVPIFTHKLRADGGSLYHILVRYPDGRIEDPSKILGMR